MAADFSSPTRLSRGFIATKATLAKLQGRWIERVYDGFFWQALARAAIMWWASTSVAFFDRVKQDFALPDPAAPSGDRCGHPTHTYAQLIISSLTTSARSKSCLVRNGHTGMGGPRLSSVSSRPGARRPGGSDRAGHRGPKRSPPCRQSRTLAVHAPQTAPPSRRTPSAAALVSNLHQLDGRDLFVALNLIAGEFRSNPYLKPQGAIKVHP